ncbi:MAG: thioredoxin domain-containing protein, partial [Myxococcaceae bacterium]
MTFRRALVVASLASLGLFAGCKQDKPAQPAANAQAKAPIAALAGAQAKVVLQKISLPETAPSIGPADAKVTIVEWSDFQCPFCSRAKGTVDQVREQYGNDVRVVFRHQPLPFHPQAQIAAEASMAAHEQGKFWEYHDKLFANAKALMRADLERYAQELGLDLAKFKEALDTGKFKAVVQADAAEGAKVGANGTPTFFINGRKLVGAQPIDAFKREIDAEITIANQLIEKGTKPSEIYAARMAEASTAPAPQARSAQQDDTVHEVPVGDSPAKGKADAPVTVVAFSDFQCPFCSRVVPTLKSLEEKYGEKVRVVFKHQPLPFHQDARLAAAASMAAHEQGKFWEYHDKLFANAKALKRPELEKYAQELGLDLAKFKAALDANKYESVIANDQALAKKVGANGTPTFFINGRKLVGAQPL